MPLLSQANLRNRRHNFSQKPCSFTKMVLGNFSYGDIEKRCLHALSSKTTGYIGSYRTAWLMGHKIRHAMIQRNDLYTLNGMVEADEIFIGGKQSLEDRRKAGSNKTPFLIALEENSDGGPRFLSFEELETIYEQHVIPAIKHNIRLGSTIKSDGDGVYVKASKAGYEHERLVAMKEPEKTYEHLKWINTITSNLKRYLLSTHHGVFPKYRKVFLAEFAYRFNRRHWPYQAFDRLLYACIQAHPVPLPVLRA